MAPSRQDLRYETLTPLVRLAIHYRPRAFFYLYPFPFALTVNEEDMVVFEKKPGFWKFLPYYMSLFVITGMMGLPFCNYVIFSYLFDFRISSTLHISLLEVMLLFALASFAVSELVTINILLWFPELMLEFMALSELERCCKLSLCQIHYFNLFYFKSFLMVGNKPR